MVSATEITTDEREDEQRVDDDPPAAGDDDPVDAQGQQHPVHGGGRAGTPTGRCPVGSRSPAAGPAGTPRTCDRYGPGSRRGSRRLVLAHEVDRQVAVLAVGDRRIAARSHGPEDAGQLGVAVEPPVVGRGAVAATTWCRRGRPTAAPGGRSGWCCRCTRARRAARRPPRRRPSHPSPPLELDLRATQDHRRDQQQAQAIISDRVRASAPSTTPSATARPRLRPVAEPVDEPDEGRDPEQRAGSDSSSRS